MPSLVQYQLSVDANFKPQGDVLFPSRYVDAYVFDGLGVAQDVTIPTGARVAMFSSNSNFYVNFLGTAAEPTVNVVNGSASELNPAARDISGLTSFSMVAMEACIVTIAFFT